MPQYVTRHVVAVSVSHKHKVHRPPDGARGVYDKPNPRALYVHASVVKNPHRNSLTHNFYASPLISSRDVVSLC